MAGIITPVYYGTKAKLVLSKLLDTPKENRSTCSGYFYDAFFNNWVGFTSIDNSLFELEFTSEKEAKFFCYNE